jgi:hypothetical protein
LPEPATITRPQASGEIAGGPRSLLKRALYVLRLVLVNLLVFAVAVELASIVLVHLKKWPSTRPTYHLTYEHYWTDTNPAFGIWHPPNGHFRRAEGCSSWEYSTNSYGARDVERSRHSSQPRTIVLGDSFIDGYGVNDSDRLTNILERRTGLEHLNFGTAGGFSPLQYALVYRTLASGFDHDRVLVSVLPDNDFHEMDKTWLEQNYAGQYRPYYNDDLSIGYTGVYHGEEHDGLWQRVEGLMRAYLASYHVGQYLAIAHFTKYRTYSGYNDFSEVDLTRLEAALPDIKHTADQHGAKVYVLLVPRPNDFKRAQQGSDRLGPVLENWGAAHGIVIKDLLPEMVAATHGNYASLFLACDDHWSPYGARIAANIIEPWLYGQ